MQLVFKEELKIENVNNIPIRFIKNSDLGKIFVPYLDYKSS